MAMFQKKKKNLYITISKGKERPAKIVQNRSVFQQRNRKEPSDQLNCNSFPLENSVTSLIQQYSEVISVKNISSKKIKNAYTSHQKRTNDISAISKIR